MKNDIKGVSKAQAHTVEYEVGKYREVFPLFFLFFVFCFLREADSNPLLQHTRSDSSNVSELPNKIFPMEELNVVIWIEVLRYKDFLLV